MPRQCLRYLALPLLLIGSSSATRAKDLNISALQVERMKIELAQVKDATTEAIALLPGTVVPALNARIAATAPFAGTVAQVHVLPGQSVEKGDRLATVVSRELLDVMSELRQSEAELQAVEAVARRKRSLADKDIGSPLLAEEADAQVAKVRAVIEQRKRSLGLGGITLGDAGAYTITAGQSGVIVEVQVMPGSKLEAMAPAVAIASSTEVWIEAQVPAGLVSRVRPGDSVQVIDGPIGRVVAIGGSLDRLTRSASMLASVSNGAGLLPGQMVTLTVLRPTESGGLEVPANAVAWIDDTHIVFVRSEDGFTPKRVTLRGKSPAGATVAGDVAPGQQVAASGLPQLEAMLAGE